MNHCLCSGARFFAAFALAVGVIAGSSLSLSASDRDDIIGWRVPVFVAQDLDGNEVTLYDQGESAATVIVFMGTDCPIGNFYMPELNRLNAEYQGKEVRFVGINSMQQDSIEDLKEHIEKFKVEFEVWKDADQTVMDLFGADRIPMAYLLDRRGNVRYRGRIDDRKGYNHQREEANREDLRIAIDELLDESLNDEGKRTPIADRVSKTETRVEGCKITRVNRLEGEGEITYSSHVAQIIFDKCAKCHHEGTAAPHELLSYRQVKNELEMIRETVLQRRMPPWNIDPRYPEGHTISNDLSLTQKEIDTLVTWIENGAPLGDEASIPEAPTFTNGWTIPEPDAIVKMPKEFNIPADGVVKYMHFKTDPAEIEGYPGGGKEDVWVQMSEARPGSWRGVHHIIAYTVDPNDESERRLLTGSVAGYAPGEEPVILPEGVAFKIPAGHHIAWQMHYTPYGTADVDRSEVGLIFSKEKPKKELIQSLAIKDDFEIPAHAKNVEFTARTRAFPVDLDLLSLMPHMHFRGSAFKYLLVDRNGTETVLLNVPQYDFNWQHRYYFEEPIRAEAGSYIKVVACYDNSEENEHLHTDKHATWTEPVYWGDQTWEEMLIGFFTAVRADQPKARVSRKPERE